MKRANFILLVFNMFIYILYEMDVKQHSTKCVHVEQKGTIATFASFKQINQ